MEIEPPPQNEKVIAYGLLGYEAGILKGQISLTLEFATIPEEAPVGKRRVFRTAMTPDAALRLAMGLLEATRSHLFGRDALPSDAKH